MVLAVVLNQPRKVDSVRYGLLLVATGILISIGNYLFQIYSRLRLGETEFAALSGFVAIVSAVGVVLGGIRTFVVATAPESLIPLTLETPVHRQSIQNNWSLLRWLPLLLLVVTVSASQLMSLSYWHLALCSACIVFSFLATGKLLACFRYSTILMAAGLGVAFKFVSLELVLRVGNEIRAKGSLAISLAFLMSTQLLVLLSPKNQPLALRSSGQVFRRILLSNLVIGVLAGIDTLIVVYLPAMTDPSQYLTMAIFAKSSGVATMALSDLYMPLMRSKAAIDGALKRWAIQILLIGISHLIVSISLFRWMLSTLFEVQLSAPILGLTSIFGTLQGVFVFLAYRQIFSGVFRIVKTGLFFGVLLAMVFSTLDIPLTLVPATYCIAFLSIILLGSFPKGLVPSSGMVNTD